MAYPEYSRMHGAGNSFVITDCTSASLPEEACRSLARELCALHGADGFIALFPDNELDFSMLFINSDGSVGEMCGNGARCVARYGFEHGLAKDSENILFRSTAGPIWGRRITDELYQVKLNSPSVLSLHTRCEVLGKEFDCGYTELGNPGIPHAVVETELSAFDDLSSLRQTGSALRRSPVFPKGANVTFAAVTGERSVKAVTFERGVEDFTLACGTGSGATALILSLRGRISSPAVDIHMPGGVLTVELSESAGQWKLLLTGPTAYIK